MPSSIEVDDQRQDFTNYLKEHFDGVASHLFNEPFSYDEWDSNGFTVVLNKEPSEQEQTKMCEMFNGIPVRWDTPTVKNETPRKKADIVMSVTLKPVGK